MRRAVFMMLTLALAACGGGGTTIGAAAPALPVATSAPLATPTPVQSATQTPAATPTPTGAPTTAPTSAPTSVPTGSAGPTLSIAALDFDAIGYTQSVIATEAGYTGTLSATSSDCAGVATFSPVSHGGPSMTVSIVSVAAGQCHLTVSDASGGHATLTIGVTTLSGSIN